MAGSRSATRSIRDASCHKARPLDPQTPTWCRSGAPVKSASPPIQGGLYSPLSRWHMCSGGPGTEMRSRATTGRHSAGGFLRQRRDRHKRSMCIPACWRCSWSRRIGAPPSPTLRHGERVRHHDFRWHCSVPSGKLWWRAHTTIDRRRAPKSYRAPHSIKFNDAVRSYCAAFSLLAAE